MPGKNQVSDGNALSLDFRNTSKINLHNLTILINGYDNNLSEIENFHYLDKYLFTIAGDSIFNYGFNLRD